VETFLGIVLGIALAAACGFRVFVPFLVVSVAANLGHLPLAGGFEWLGTPAALVLLAVATAAEILAFYVPWVDNLLDAVAQPAATVAGILVAAAVMTELPAVWKWALAIVAGGGVAGTLQGGTLLSRGLSTVTTGGLGNWIVTTIENVAAFVVSVLAILMPLAAFALVVALLLFVARLFRRRRRAAVP